MSIEFQTNYTAQVCEQGVRAYWRRMFGWRTAMEMAVCVAVFYFVAPHSPGWVVGALFAGIGFYLVLAAAAFFYQRHRMLLQLKASGELRAEWQLGDKKLTVATPQGKSELAYAAIKEIYQRPDVWLLFVSRRAFSTLPVGQVPSNARAFLQRKVMDAGGKIT